MADTFTANYNWDKPQVNADSGTWGALWNTNLDSIDSTVFTISGVANAALPKAGGTMTGALLLAAGSVGAPSLSFTGDTDSGLFYVSADSFAMVANGAAVFTAAAGGVTADGTLSVTGTTTLGVTNITGKLTGTASTAGSAGLNVPPGVAPTTPVNGDLWVTASGFFGQIGGTTFTFATTANTVTSFNGRSGAVVPNSGDVTGALGFTPFNQAGDTCSGHIFISGTVASGSRNLAWLTSGSLRWLIGANTTAESGGNAGSDLNLNCYNDTGALILTAVSITRATGLVTIGAGLHLSGAANITAGADITGVLATPSATEAGYMGVPQNVQGGSYTTVASDRGKEILLNGATGTITLDSTVGFAIGTTIELTAWHGCVMTITVGAGQTLVWTPSGTTGNRTITGPGSAYAQWKGSGEWWIKGDLS